MEFLTQFDWSQVGLLITTIGLAVGAIKAKNWLQLIVSLRKSLHLVMNIIDETDAIEVKEGVKKVSTYVGIAEVVVKELDQARSAPVATEESLQS
jgi:hypothetical protein